MYIVNLHNNNKLRKVLHESLIMGLWILPLCLVAYNSFALPEGAEVLNGESTVTTVPGDPNHQIIIQNTPKSIINWQSFNIAEHQITEFQQPSSTSIVLNRVLGPQESSIQGRLKANGQVWLINPSGIMFGPHSKVDVAGLLATTSDINDIDFMNAQNHQYHFHSLNDSHATVINQGHIKVQDSGLVALVAPTIQNTGIIEAHVGKIILGAGSEYTVDLYGDNLIHFATGTPVNQSLPSEGISHTGTLIADGGTVLLTTSDALQVIDNVINMEGFIQANTVESLQGNIILSAGIPQNKNQKKGVVRVTGEIQSTGLESNQKGGNITLIGEQIGIFENAKMDVSGNVQGGIIRIGGNKQGLGELPHADAVFISPESCIYANAKTMGNGGEIIVWADTSTRCYGSLSAEGGPLGGDGGFIETSGGFIDIQGIKLNLRSYAGTPGTYLWDPYNVQISSAPTMNMVLVSGPLPPPVFEPSGTGANFDIFTLRSTLAGNNIRITTRNFSGAEAGNITFVSPLSVGSISSPSGSTAMSLLADGNIFINASIGRSSSAGSLDVGFIASINVQVNASIDLTPGGGSAFISTLGLTGLAPITVSSLDLNIQNSNFIGSVNGVTDGSNIGGMAASIAAYGPNYVGSSRYFFNGNEFFTSPAPPPPPLPPPPPPPPPPTPPTPTPTLTTTTIDTLVPPNTVLPPANLTITPITPTLEEETIEIEKDKTISTADTKSSTTNTSSTSTTETSSNTVPANTTPGITPTTTTTTINSSSSLPPPAPINPVVNSPVATPVFTLPISNPIPSTGAIPLSYDVPIGGKLEPVINFKNEFPIPNIEDRAGIPNLTVEKSPYDINIVKPPIVVPTSNSVGPTGVNGTDVGLGSAGIGSGLQEPVVKKEPKVFKNAHEIIGIGTMEENVSEAPCPEGPNCIPGVDSFNSYYSILHSLEKSK